MKYNNKANLTIGEIYKFKTHPESGLYDVLDHISTFKGKILEEYANHYKAIVLTDKNFLREISISINKSNLHCDRVKVI